MPSPCAGVDMTLGCDSLSVCLSVCSEALERQRQMYERQMQLLRSQLMSPSTPSLPYSFESAFISRMTPTGAAPTASLHPRYQQWAHDR